MDLSKKVFGANVDKKIRDYFKFLQEGTFVIEPGQSVGAKREGLGKTSTGEGYLGDRTPYARMWTAVNVREEVEKSFVGPALDGGSKNLGKTYNLVIILLI